MDGQTTFIDFDDSSIGDNRGTVDDDDLRRADEGPLFCEMENDENNCEDNNDHEGDRPIYEGASLTLDHSMMLILTFSFKYGLTGQCLTDLLILISLHCRTPNLIKTSLYLFRKYFNNIKIPLTFHKYCSRCFFNITTDQRICPLCNSNLDDPKQISYFVEIPMALQLQKMFQRIDFHTDLCHRFHRQKSDSHNIEDIYDGNQYMKHSKAEGLLSNPNNISLMWFTDGVALFKSSKYSIWPLFFSINELPYHKRMKSENLLFGGLWFGNVKPAMGTFLKPFINTLDGMLKNGVEVDCCHCDKKINVKALLLCGTCDLPAKCIVLNMNQFNGAHSCIKCTQEGKVVEAGNGHTRVFPFINENPFGPSRSHEQMKRNAAEAVESGQTVLGIKGPSWFSYVQPDIVCGTAVDYMHCVLLGIVKKLLTLWFSPTYSSESFSISKKKLEADERLLSVKPPNFVSRVPRSLSDHSSYWKANECRAWLLFYSVPVLYGLMSDELYQHHLMLVEAIYLLSKASISPAVLLRSKELLTYFVCLYEEFYGERHMSANLHQLLHLPDVVKELGPLWVYSCFSFEDMNGQLVKLFHGTQHPQIQISSAISTLLHLPEMGQRFDKTTAAGKFYFDMCRKGSQTIYKCKDISDGIGVVGRRVLRILSNEHRNLLKDVLEKEPKEVLTFHRMYKDGILYHSLQYTAVEQRNSYTVLFSENEIEKKYGHVEKYLEVYTECNGKCSLNCLCEAQYFAVVKELENNTEVCLQNGVHDSALENIIPVKSKFVQYKVIPVGYIQAMCVYIQLNDGKDTAFVSMSPNSIEKD